MFIDPFTFFDTPEKQEAPKVYPTLDVRGYNNQLDPNAGNFQEYTYELEWMECSWKIVHKTTELVTAYWYPWIRYPSSSN